MTLMRVVIAWMAVGGWFLVWELAGRQAGRGGTGPWLRLPLWHYLGEAALLVLLGALWFASLGAGGWWLVFALLGGLLEWRVPREGRRGRRRLPRELAARALGVLRVVAAGGLLAWRLAPA